MNEFEFNLIKNLPDFENYKDCDFENVSFLYDTLHNFFDLSVFDVIFIIFKCPEILKCDKDELYKNIEAIAKITNLKSRNIYYFILKFPFVLTIRNELILYKMKIISLYFAMSIKDVIKTIYIYPDLMFLTKLQIINQIKMLSTNLDEYGFGLRRILRSTPEIAFISEDKIFNLKELFMKGFTLSSSETLCLLKLVPQIMLMDKDDVEKKLNMFYPKFFVKRDIKEILPSFPAILLLSEKEFYQKVIDLQKCLDIEFKNISKFIKMNPDVLFIEDIKNKIAGLKKYNINTEFIKLNPYLLTSLEIALPIKFVLTRILGIENCFVDVCKMNTKLFLARFLFMQTNGYFEHKDLILNETEFFNKYDISSKMLLLNYSIKAENIENICKYYVKLKDTIKGWTDVVLPDSTQFQEFIMEKDNSKEIPEIMGFYNKINMGKSEYEIYNVLSKKHLNFIEFKMILKKCPALKSCNADNISKIFEIIRKNCVLYEDAVKIIVDNPSLFTYPIKDFDYVLRQSENNNLSFIEMLKEI